ncbi:MAG: putative transport system ATP-binding protein [Solirubrobacteraceae bacterium]|nr:putative transport system ATP-binding protein [Solirubrobacteraceae bacterium]
MTAGAALVECSGVSRTFGEGSGATLALAPTDCVVAAGDRIALVGPSGSGKSTLLHLMAGLDAPTHGRIGWPAIGARSQLQPGRVAVIFQGPSLIEALTVQENVALALILDGLRYAEARAAALDALALLGLGELADKLPEEISGGQMQRVAIARALAGRPVLILADEPTGQLDRANGAIVIDVLLDAARHAGAAVVVSTHDPTVAARFPKRWQMESGQLTTW